MVPLASRLITLSSPTAVAQVYPERGFQLFGFQVKHGDDWVETIHAIMDPFEPADRRYGNPVLFPAVGVTNGSLPDAWDHDGRALPMPSHGWARNVYWQIQEQTESSLTASVVPHPGFKLGFPFDFELRLTYRVEGNSLHIESVVRNSGDKPFPYALGFHPYLKIPAVSAAYVIDLPAGTRVRSADGWRTFETEAFAARTISASDAELPSSIVLKDTGASYLEVRNEATQTATRVSVEGSEQPFPVWVAWNASASAPYICLEPWTDTPNALNRPGTLMLAAGQSHRYHTAISLRAL